MTTSKVIALTFVILAFISIMSILLWRENSGIQYRVVELNSGMYVTEMKVPFHSWSEINRFDDEEEACMFVADTIQEDWLEETNRVVDCRVRHVNDRRYK